MSVVDLSLSSAHRHMLFTESAIEEDVARERGYRTVTSRDDLLALGFSTTQARVPGLLMPLHATTGGEPPLHVYRPDHPRAQRDKTGKERVLKYEVPAGHGVRVDCPPRCRAALADPSRPLLITEGIKKGDALASRGATAIALLGVWGFLGRNRFGGTALLADLDAIAWTGRQVFLCFDSDVMTKPAVRQALERLTEHLERKGASVSALYLPNGPDGRKLGCDDYLAEGHTLDDLLALAEAPRPAPQPATAQVELLDDPPAVMRRPVALIDGRGYIATYLPVRVTVREALNKAGDVVAVHPPRVSEEMRLFVLGADGTIYGEGGDQPLEALGFSVQLPDLPRGAGMLRTRAAKAFRTGYRPDAASVVERVARVFDAHVDFARSLGPQERLCRVLACNVVSTYLLPAWQAVGYPYFNGEAGTGKTQAGTCWAMCACLGAVILSSGTFAALRDLAEAGCALMFDDAEVLSDLRRCDPDKRELALSGYRRGALVPLKEQAGDKTWRIRWVDAFAPRAFTAIRRPDGVLGSRCIVLPLVRTADPRRGNADPADTTHWPCPRADLVDDLWLLGLTLVAEAKGVWRELDAEVQTVGRNLEIWRATLATARLLDRHGAKGLEDDVRAVMAAYAAERADLAQDDGTVAVVRALIACVTARGGTLTTADTWTPVDTLDTKSKTWTLSASEVCKKIKAEADDEDDDDGEAAGWATPSRVGRILGRLRFRRSRAPDRGRGRGWEITTADVAALARAYGLLDAAATTGCPDGQPEALVSNVSARVHVSTPEAVDAPQAGGNGWHDLANITDPYDGDSDPLGIDLDALAITPSPENGSAPKELPDDYQGPAVWVHGGQEEPVEVLGTYGPGSDGRRYFRVAGSPTGIPADELEGEAWEEF